MTEDPAFGFVQSLNLRAALRAGRTTPTLQSTSCRCPALLVCRRMVEAVGLGLVPSRGGSKSLNRSIRHESLCSCSHSCVKVPPPAAPREAAGSQAFDEIRCWSPGPTASSVGAPEQPCAELCTWRVEVAPDPPPRELFEDGSVVLAFDHLPIRQEMRRGLTSRLCLSVYSASSQHNLGQQRHFCDSRSN